MFLIKTQHLIKTMLWLQHLGGVHIECHLSRLCDEVIYSVAYNDPRDEYDFWRAMSSIPYVNNGEGEQELIFSVIDERDLQ